MNELPLWFAGAPTHPPKSDFAGDDRRVPHLEVTNSLVHRERGLGEERARHVRVTIGEHQRGERKRIVLYPPLLFTLQPRDVGEVLALLAVVQRGEIASGRVPARIVMQEVFDALQPELAEHVSGLLTKNADEFG